VGGNVTNDGNATVTERGVVYATTQTPTTSNTKVPLGTGTGSFTTNITGLTSGTTYYVRAYAINSQGTTYGSQEVFVCSLTLSLPSVTTATATGVTSTGATLGGNVTNDGNATVTERGVVYATTQTPTTSNTKVPLGTGTGSFTTNITGLTSGTTYYVRAYAINSQGTTYGSQEVFVCSLTLSQPTVNTTAATGVTTTGATLGGNVTNDGNATVTERGVVYATTQSPTTSNTKVPLGTGTGSFTTNITGLTSGTTYYVRAYAINSQGTAYGSQEVFVCSLTLSLPSVNTTAATGVTTTGATLGGNVTNDGNATVTERGLVYATTQTPTTSNTKVPLGTGTGSFTTNITGLTSGTTYYARAYAINSQGTAYGSQIALMTTTTGQSQTGSDYYLPLRLGNYIKHYDTGRQMTITYTIIGTETINGEIYYIEEAKEVKDNGTQPPNIFRMAWFRKDTNGNIVFGAYSPDGTIGNKVILPSSTLFFPNQYLTVGYTQVFTIDSSNTSTALVISTTASAGIYTNCIQIRETTKVNGVTTLVDDQYYAYKIGLVKTERTFPASKVGVSSITDFVTTP
jgi:hypothetical protein